MALCNDHSGGKPPIHDECNWGASDKRWDAGYFKQLKKALGLFFDVSTEDPSQLGQLVLRPNSGNPRLKWFNGVEVKALSHVGEVAGAPPSAVVISLSYPNEELEAAGFTFVKRLTAWVRKMNFGGYPRYGAKGFYVGSQIYLCCGERYGGGLFKDTWLYEDGEWIDTGDVYPHLMSGGSSVSAKNLGGLDGGIVGLGYDGANVRRDLNFYFPGEGWEEAEELPPQAPARMCAMAWILGRGLFICGGRGLGSPLPPFFSDCWRWDFDTGLWEEVSPMPIPLAAAACFTFDNDSTGIHEAYVATGVTEAFVLTNACFRFFFDEVKGEWAWEDAPEFPGHPRCDASGFSYPLENIGYLACGFDFLFSMDDVWTFDRETGLWLEKWPFAGRTRYAQVGLATDAGIFIMTGAKWTATVLERLGDCWELNELFLYQK